MDENNKLFPLFKVCTRVPLYFGVPLMPLLSMCICVVIFSSIVSFWFLILIIPLWGIMGELSKKDDRAFRILWLWFDTAFANKNKSFWGASSYSANDYRKRGKIK